MNTQLCAKVYQLFIGGKVINKMRIDADNDEPIPDKLFSEISSNLDSYTEHFERCGFELVTELDDCFFVRPRHEDKPALELASKVQALLIIFGKAVTQRSEIEVLYDPRAGLSKDTVDSINQTIEYRTVLNAVKVKDNLWEECKSLLVNRQLATLNRSGSLVFLTGAESMYKELIAHGAADVV